MLTVGADGDDPVKKHKIESDELAATLLDLIKREVPPKKMLKSVQKQHPKASKKQIVLAAFAMMIDAASKDPETARKLHGFAIVNRTST
jgi:hypothetical protein